MQVRSLIKPEIGLFLVIGVFSGCATLDRSSTRASSEIPTSAVVEEVNIAYDPSEPKFLVVVEPFGSSTETETQINTNGSVYCDKGGCNTAINHKEVGNGIAAQLMTALTNVGNVSVADRAALKKNSDGSYRASLRKAEKGPFIVRGVITEISEVAEESEGGTSAAFGLIGVIAAVAGAVTEHNGLFWTGVGLAGAAPAFEATEHTTTGMVTIDLQILDGKTLRLVKGMKVSGSFKSKTAKNSVSLLGVTNENKDSSKSVLSQAVRVAMNDATSKIWETLKEER